MALFRWRAFCFGVRCWGAAATRAGWRWAGRVAFGHYAAGGCGVVSGWRAGNWQLVGTEGQGEARARGSVLAVMLSAWEAGSTARMPCVGVEGRLAGGRRDRGGSRSLRR